jgi:hypothetical protein
MADLSELLRRVEEANGPDRELDVRIHFAVNPSQRIMIDGGSVRPPIRPASYITLEEFDLAGWSDWGSLALHVGAAPITASLDAALALVEKRMPGAWVRLDKIGDQCTAWIMSPPPDGTIGRPAPPALPTLALATVAELLRAEIAKEGGRSALSEGEKADD